MITFLNKYKAYILGMYAFLILLQFIIKDRIFPLSILFYATPLILIILYGIFITIIYNKQKRIVISSVLVLILLIFQYSKSHYNFPQAKTNLGENNSVLFWNIAKNEKGFPLEIISKKIEEFPVKILTFVETDAVSDEELTLLKNKFKQYYFQKLKGNMIVGIKGNIASINYKTEDKSFKFNHIISEINNKKTSILIVDVYASPFYSKEKALKSIITYSKTNKIDIILGDFNTPYESIHFNNYQENYTSFHEYSEVFTATWAFGIPLLELDQIWIDKSFKPLKLKKYNFSFSDHQLLIADYTLN